MRLFVVILLLGSLVPVPACARGREQAPVRDAATAEPSASPVSAAGPRDVLASAPVGPDGIPVLVQEVVDRFAGEHVKLKPGDVSDEGVPVVLRSYVDALSGSDYTFDGRGVLRIFGDKPLANRPAPAGDSPLSDAELIAKARVWVERHLGERAASWRANVTRRVEGTSPEGDVYEIAVELRERVGKVPSPNFVEVVVTRDGTPKLLTRDDGPLDAVDPTPSITKEKAAEAAAAKAGAPGATLASAELLILRAPDGSTPLVWRLELKRPERKGVAMMGNDTIGAEVDAHSGQVLSYSQ